MTTNYYGPDSEAALEAETLALFAELGRERAGAQAESAGNCPVTGRETTGGVLLLHRLRAALARLNPDVPANAIGLARSFVSSSTPTSAQPTTTPTPATLMPAWGASC